MSCNHKFLLQVEEEGLSRQASREAAWPQPSQAPAASHPWDARHATRKSLGCSAQEWQEGGEVLVVDEECPEAAAAGAGALPEAGHDPRTVSRPALHLNDVDASRAHTLAAAPAPCEAEDAQASASEAKPVRGSRLVQQLACMAAMPCPDGVPMACSGASAGQGGPLLQPASATSGHTLGTMSGPWLQASPAPKAASQGCVRPSYMRRSSGLTASTAPIDITGGHEQPMMSPRASGWAGMGRGPSADFLLNSSAKSYDIMGSCAQAMPTATCSQQLLNDLSSLTKSSPLTASILQHSLMSKAPSLAAHSISNMLCPWDGVMAQTSPVPLAISPSGPHAGMSSLLMPSTEVECLGGAAGSSAAASSNPRRTTRTYIRGISLPMACTGDQGEPSTRLKEGARGPESCAEAEQASAAADAASFASLERPCTSAGGPRASVACDAAARIASPAAEQQTEGAEVAPSLLDGVFSEHLPEALAPPIATKQYQVNIWVTEHPHTKE